MLRHEGKSIMMDFGDWPEAGKIDNAGEDTGPLRRNEKM